MADNNPVPKAVPVDRGPARPAAKAGDGYATQPSLLQRLRRPEEHAAWERFVQLYTPLLFHWARNAGLAHHQAADLVQDVLLVLVQKLPEFDYQPGKSFRGWLRTVTLNKWREGCRRRKEVIAGEGEALPEPVAPDGAEVFAEAEYRRHLSGRALRLMQQEFEPATWKACWECVVNERPPAEVAAELGLSVDQVYGAKYRVLRRLRQELEGLLD